MRLVAIDLEGTGAQDGETEAILEIALVPLTEALVPDTARAFATVINPLRPVPKRPWISPSLTDTALRSAPTLDQVEPAIADLVDGTHLLGHNVRVDWNLLHRRLPGLRPAGLLDTLRLARALPGAGSRSLTTLLEHFDLTGAVNTHVPAGRPHRALWDAVACALLFARLRAEPRWATFTHITDAAAVAADGVPGPEPHQPSLFE